MANYDKIVGGLINPALTETDPLAVKLADFDSAVSSLISTAVANLVNSAPSTLDTLNELATALGNDPNFATTITNLLAGKASSSHTHSEADITSLITDLASKASSTHTHAMSDITGLVSALAGKATPSDITTAIDNLVNSAPGALDTLSELATALGNDANFATTITTALAGKAPQSTTYTKTEVDSLVAGAGGSTFSAVAYENITAGDFVEQINDAGTYKVRKVKAKTMSAVTHITSPFGQVNMKMIYHATADRVVIITPNQASGGSNYLNTIVVQVSGTTITAQTAVVQLSQGVAEIVGFYDSAISKIIIFFRQTTGTTGLYVATIDVSGNTATLSTPQLVSSATNAPNSILKCGSAYVATYTNNSSDICHTAMTLSGTTFTIGSVTGLGVNASDGYCSVNWDSSQSKLFTIYKDTLTSGDWSVKYFVQTISGTTFSTAQGATTLFSNTAFTVYNLVQYVANGKLYFIAEGSSYRGTSIKTIYRISISGDTLTFDAEFRMGTMSSAVTGNQGNICQDGASLYIIGQIGSGSQPIGVYKIDLTSTSFTFDNRFYIESREIPNPARFVKCGSSFLHLNAQSTNNKFALRAFSQLPTTAKCIGIAQETKTTGQTIKVAVNGQISTIHSNLPQGVALYMTDDNTITENYTPFRLGKALSDTKLAINLYEDIGLL